jgi:hypothetical protein
MKKLLLFCNLVTVATLVTLIGCATQPANKIIVQPDVVYMGAAGWAFSYSPNMPKNPIPLGGTNGWFFDFPASDGVHMVLVPYNANKPHTTLTITYRVTAISGAPKFVSVDPGSGRAACFRPMLERAGDQMLATQEFYRWWSAPVTLVGDGKIHTAVYQLTPDKWTAVFGKGNAVEFAATWKSNLMAVGISFGGDFAAHGDCVAGGKARFELLNYSIQ